MMSTWAYELSDEVLVNKLLQASARAGVAGSRLVIDLSGSSHRTEMLYLWGVLMARLKGEQPPLGREAQVKRREDAYRFVSLNTHDYGYREFPKGATPILTVSRIWYWPNSPLSDGRSGRSWRWGFEFKDLEGWYYPAEKFELVPVEATEPA